MTAPETPPPARFDTALLNVVREIDRHEASGGWDRGPRLYALVDTALLLGQEPALGTALGIDPATAAVLTPVEQESLPDDAVLDDALATIGWPPEVAGCALVVERLVLPPGAEQELPADPADPAALAASAASHAGRQDVRMVVAVLRDGRKECALRLRAHDSETEVLTGPDLVPALTAALLSTLT